MMKASLLLCPFFVCSAVAEESSLTEFDLEFSEQESSLPVQGYFQSTLDYLPVLSQLGGARQRLWAEVDNEWKISASGSDRWALGAAASLDWNPSVGARKGARTTSLRIRRFQLSWLADSARLSVGRQTMLWGNGTSLSGGSYFNPVDLDDPFASGRAINYLASDALRYQYYYQESELDLIFMPRMPLAALPERHSTWDTIDGDVLRPLLEEATREYQNVWGARISTRAQGFDYAVGFYRGVSQSPSLSLDGDALSVVNPVYSSLFLQASLVAWESLVRGEYTRDQGRLSDIDDGNPRAGTIERVMIGWDGFYSAVSLTAEAMVRLDRVRGQQTYNGAYSGFYEWQAGDWGIELGGVINISDHSNMQELIVTRKFGDQFQLSGTGRAFWGDGRSEYGSYHSLSAFGVELTWYL